MRKIAALVPMRHNSVRVPGKNYRSFAGRPLYHHVIETLLGAASVTEVVIDTDSPFILEDAAKHFPTVRLLERPPHLRDGEIPMNEVLMNTTGQVEADVYIQTHSTNPLLTSATVDAAVQAYDKQYPAFDSLFSVTRLHTRLWDGLTRPINHNPAILLRTQDLPPVFEENSCLFLFTRQTLIQRRNRLGERPLMFEMDALEATDIDEELHFQVAELLYLKRREAAQK